MPKVFNRILVLFVLLSFSPNVFGQKPNLKFKNYSTQDGLTSNTVIDVCRDSTGFIWIATLDGLNRFDGNTFKTYQAQKEDSTSILSNFVHRLYVTKVGQLLVASSMGLNIYNPNKDNFKSLISNVAVKDIVEFGQNEYLILTTNNIIRLNLKFETIKSYEEVSHSFFKLYKDLENRIWIADYMRGIFLLDSNKNLQNFGPQNNKNIASLCNGIVQTKDSLIVASNYTEGLTFFDKENQKFVPYKKYAFIKKTTSINIDKEGKIWIGTDGNGLYLVDKKGKIFNYKTSDVNGDLSLNVTNNIFFDNKHGVWLGGHHKGLDFVNLFCSNFQHVTSLNSEEGNKIISSFYKGTDGSTWIGTDGGGIAQKTEGKTILYSKENSNLSNNNVVKIATDSEGKLWIGTYNGGLNILDPNKGKINSYLHNVNDSSSIPHNDTWMIYKDLSQNMWVGTSNGLCKFNPSTNSFSSYTTENSNLTSANIRAICSKDSNNLYIGTVNGLFLLNTATNFIRKFEVDSTHRLFGKQLLIFHIHRSKNDTLWMSTYGEGLVAFSEKDENFTNWKSSEGLSNNFICGIVEDTLSRLWLTTQNGLSVFNANRKEFQNYYIDDGLQDNQFSIGAYLKWNEDSIFIGGTNGYNVFSPYQLTHNSTPPPIEFIDFKIFNESSFCKETPHGDFKHVSQVDTIVLNYDQNTISFHFGVLNYIKSQKNKASYFLKGVDKDWSPASNNMFANYTNLSPGTYQFMLRGANDSDVWNVIPKTITVIVTPPFWQTWWFITLTTIIALLLVVVIPIWSLILTKRNLKHKNDSLEANQKLLRSQMNPHFIFNTLTTIQNYILEGEKLKASKLIANFGKLIRDVLESSRENYISLTQELRLITNYLEVQQSRFNKTFDFEIKMNVQRNHDEITLAPMLLQPFLENAIEHGVKGKTDGFIWVLIEEQNNRLFFEINDNGPGFKKQQRINHNSIAISITNERLQKINKDKSYTVEISTSTKGGTCVTFSVPLTLVTA